MSGRAIQRYLLVSRRGLAVIACAQSRRTCTVRAHRPCALKLKLRTRGRRPLVIGQARVRLKGGKMARVMLKLNAKTRRALRLKRTIARLRTVKVLVTGSAADTARHRVKLSRAVLLRR